MLCTAAGICRRGLGSHARFRSVGGAPRTTCRCLPIIFYSVFGPGARRQFWAMACNPAGG